MSKKILVTGSREFDDGQMMLDALTAEMDGERLIVISGGARGADAYAHFVASKLSGVLSATMLADWDNDGRGAGPIRNSAMLELGPDLVLAFYKEGAANRGTQHCVNAAKQLDIPVKEFWQTNE